MIQFLIFAIVILLAYIFVLKIEICNLKIDNKNDKENYEYIHNKYKFYYDLSETLYKVYRPLDIFPTDTVREISKLSIF